MTLAQRRAAKLRRGINNSEPNQERQLVPVNQELVNWSSSSSNSSDMIELMDIDTADDQRLVELINEADFRIFIESMYLRVSYGGMGQGQDVITISGANCGTSFFLNDLERKFMRVSTSLLILSHNLQTMISATKAVWGVKPFVWNLFRNSGLDDLMELNDLVISKVVKIFENVREWDELCPADRMTLVHNSHFKIVIGQLIQCAANLDNLYFECEKAKADALPLARQIQKMILFAKNFRMELANNQVVLLLLGPILFFNPRRLNIRHPSTVK